MLGELTNVGRNSTFKFGSALRDLYISKCASFDWKWSPTTDHIHRLGFIPDILDSQESIYLRLASIHSFTDSMTQSLGRSTNMPRTIETLQQVLHGLYPSNRTTPGLIPRVRMRQPQDENLMGNQYACPRLKQLMTGFERGRYIKELTFSDSFDWTENSV